MTNAQTPRDAGADSETRTPACTKRAWCLLPQRHDGECAEIERKRHERQGWDKRTPDPQGWRGTGSK